MAYTIGMIMHKTVLFALPFALLQQVSHAQPLSAVQTNRAEEYRLKIARTAEALGVSVYEDYPVQAGGSAAAYGQPSAIPAPALAPAPVPVKYEVPEPAFQKGGDVPAEFRGPEAVNYGGLAITFWHALGTQISDLGWFPGVKAPPSFEQVSNRVLNASVSLSYPARSAGQPSLFTDSGFVAEFEGVTGARFVNGNLARFLIDGPESFRVKDDLIRSARKSLLVSSWAFYDDTTGYEAAQMLIARKHAGVDVKVIVDNVMTYSHGPKVIKMMRDAGVQVLRHTDQERSGDVWHVKVMIADDKYAVAGGMNFGDVYSHKSGSLLWRDTDVLFSGPAVIEAKRVLADVWNAQVAARGLPFGRIDMAASSDHIFENGSARIAVVLQNPPMSSPILVSIVKAMYAATSRINIENAYFVAIPAVSRAVLDARARGVEVNLLTNSKESIDSEGKPIVDVMTKCLAQLARAGINVYLKQGAEQTLHSKFMTVDGEFANIGSYNLHPRSERIDTEVNVNILDRFSVAQLDAAFSRDLASARKVTAAAELASKPGWMSRVMSEYFYAQLSPKN